MKFTVSKDGKRRVDLRITHRLADYDFVNILCLKYAEHDPEDDGELPDLSRTEILSIVRGQLTEKPDARNWWRDDVEEEDWADELRTWFHELVKLRFPEFE